MNRYVLLLAILALVGCNNRSVKRSTNLGKIDSTKMKYIGNDTVKLVYVGGNEYAVPPEASFDRPFPIHEVVVEYEHSRPTEVYLCNHGALSDRLKLDMCARLE